MAALQGVTLAPEVGTDYMREQVTVALVLTTDRDSTELSYSALWQKAVGIFKGNVIVEEVVMDGDKPARKPATKTGLKKRATVKKKAKKKTTRHAQD